MSEKILARHSKQANVKAGDYVTCTVDWLVHLDAMFGTEGISLWNSPTKIFDPKRNIVIMDHMVPPMTEGDALADIKARKFVKDFGIEYFYDIGNHGICHQVLAEEGFALPGKLLACADSHTCASGAFNCGARGLGADEMNYLLCKGNTWYRVGSTIRYDLYNSLPEWVSGKDVFLYMAGKYGDAANKNIEFGGPGVKNLSIADRQCISTMCSELSAEFAIFPCDERLLEYIQGRAKTDFTPIEPDDDAQYEDIRQINLNEMVPYISHPHSVPGNCVPVEDLSGKIIHQAYIGSCANARIEDLKIAANVVRGKKIAPGVRMIVTPGSQKIYMQALKEGYIETLVEAGAVVTNSTCGACYGGHMGLIGKGECCISSSTRNFKGRMGSPQSEVLLASPATVAASALAGCVTDPRTINN